MFAFISVVSNYNTKNMGAIMSYTEKDFDDLMNKYKERQR